MLHPYKNQSAFTLVELLTVVAIVAALAAIVFPVVAQTREKARQTACVSNVRQLGAALISYATDNDETFPYSYRDDIDNYWPHFIAAYSGAGPKEGKLHTCPTTGLRNTTYSTNPQIVGLYSPAPASANFFQTVVRRDEVTVPASIVLLGDGLARRDGSNVEPEFVRAAAEFAYPHPALRRDHTSDANWCAPWVVPNTDDCNNKQIAWRHNRGLNGTGGANFVFCDGHAQWETPGSLRDANWDVRCKPSVGCQGKDTTPNPADYPASNAACGYQSALNCL